MPVRREHNIRGETHAQDALHYACAAVMLIAAPASANAITIGIDGRDPIRGMPEDRHLVWVALLVGCVSSHYDVAMFEAVNAIEPRYQAFQR